MSFEVPNYYDWADRELYEKLIVKDDDKLTQEERRFVNTIYHQEEYACGLDGDRE